MTHHSIATRIIRSFLTALGFLTLLGLQACGGSSTPTFTVSVSTGTGGSASETSITVEEGISTSFTITVDSGYSIEDATGCGGSIAGTTYTTGSITANCTVTVTFLANPTGYYDQGNLSVDMGATTDNGGLQAMVYDNRIMIMSVANGLLYDGLLTITQNLFTATFTIYTNGQNPIIATASGMIIPESSVTGTLTGAGIGAGTFNLVYAASNSETAALSKLERPLTSTWKSLVGGSSTVFGITIDNMGRALENEFTTDGVFSRCSLAADILTIPNTNLYRNNSLFIGGCDIMAADEFYNGLFTTRTRVSADDTLIIMLTHPDGTYAFYGEFQ